MTKRSEKLYWESYDTDGGWAWKIYHYDETGNREIILHRSARKFGYHENADDDCCQFQDDNGIDAELS